MHERVRMGGTIWWRIRRWLYFHFSSVAQSGPTFCKPINRSMPGLLVHHQLPEFTQTHVHWVSDAIEPSHPLSFPSPPAPIPPGIRVLSNESALRMRWPKYWRFSFSIITSKEILFINYQKHISGLRRDILRERGVIIREDFLWLISDSLPRIFR